MHANTKKRKKWSLNQKLFFFHAVNFERIIFDQLNPGLPLGDFYHFVKTMYVIFP